MVSFATKYTKKEKKRVAVFEELQILLVLMKRKFQSRSTNDVNVNATEKNVQCILKTQYLS